MNIKITGSGSSIPEKAELNSAFSNHTFYDASGSLIDSPNEVIIEKFKAITGIEQRRYIKEDQTVADIAIEAAEKTIDDAKADRETIDYIIVAHNVGDIALNSNQVNTLPSVASRKTSKDLENVCRWRNLLRRRRHHLRSTLPTRSPNTSRRMRFHRTFRNKPTEAGRPRNLSSTRHLENLLPFQR